jgi:polyphosphate kinase
MATATASENALRFEVPSGEVLETLTTAALPLGMKPGRPKRSFHRDIYLDTPDGELQRRGVSCRFRIGMDDRRLRAVIDPLQLGVRVELQTERVSRSARPRWLPIKTLDIAYDTVGVHSGGLSRTFHEIRIRQIAPGGPPVEEVGEALQGLYGLRPTPTRRVERAEELLSAMESQVPAETVTAVPEVTVIAVAGGWVAMRLEHGALRLPVNEGTGEDAARHALAGVVSTSDVTMDLLGTVAASPSAAAMEVWLAHVSGDVRPDNAVIRWVSFADTLALAGAPVLRDSRALAALSLLVRGDAFETLCGVSPDGGADTAILTRDELQETSATPVDGELLAPQRFLNEEISLLEFNSRVLQLADDASLPLLARLRYLAIHSSNTDEFVMVKVGVLKRLLAAGEADRGADGLGVHERLDAIAIRLRQQLAQGRRCLERQLLPALAAAGIRILRWDELEAEDSEYLTRQYDEQVFPLLTPHAVTRAPGHPFPHIENLRLSVAAMVRDEGTGRLRFGVTTLPSTLPRFIQLPDSARFVPLEDVVRANLAKLYPGRRVESVHCFRVTRIGDLDLDEDAADDLLDAVEEQVRRRPFAGVVRLEVERSMPPVMRDLLMRELQMVGGIRGTTPGAAGIYDVDGLLDPSGLMEIADLDRPELDYPPFDAGSPIPRQRPIFETLGERDVLVHHPYDAFEATTQRLFSEAAGDPDVLSIKATLYRMGTRSPVVEALIRAVEAGKEVDALVELKARFDEERNIEWVRKLERAGVHVVYGLVKLKTHSKLAMVVRRENGAVRRYVHIGTGNYNAATARLYTDLGLLSGDETLGADVNDLFNQLMGSSRPSQSGFRRLLVAPTTMLDRLLALIQREAEHARAGREGRIRAKINGLADTEVIDALYAASRAGSQVDLVVRGMCSLRPGVPGLSDGIRVVSILGRFLEHARIFHFHNGGDEEYFIGSADWRPRNLRRRLEVVTSVTDLAARQQLHRILDAELSDPTAWELSSDGSYVRRGGGKAAQQAFLEREQREKSSE